MDVVFLGTGTGVPSVERGSPGLLVEAAGKRLLIDGGSGTLRQLARAGRSYGDIDCILYTHFHPDHVGDLVPYLFATRYWPGFGRTEAVDIRGAEGLLALYGHLRAAFGHWIEPPEGRVVFRELPADRRTRFLCGRLEVEAGPVHHTPASLGYRLTDLDGRVLAVSGDTDYGPDLLELAREADLLITECSLPDDRKKDGHLTPSLAGQVAAESGAKALALTHFYPEVEGIDILAQVRAAFAGPVTLARDLMHVTL